MNECCRDDYTGAELLDDAEDNVELRWQNSSQENWANSALSHS